jgi:hypothetical protein
MTPWRGLLLALVFYLTADYCDPSIPGVFFFDTESFFVETIESRSAPRPVLLATTGPLATRDLMPRVQATAPSRPYARREPRPHLPHPYLLKAPPASAGGVDDH